MLDYFLKENIKSGLKEHAKRQHTFLNFDAIQTVLVLFDSHNWESVAPIVEDLRKNGKQVIVWTMLVKQHNAQSGIATALPNDIRIVDLNKDLNWKRVLLPEIYTEFRNLSYDTFLDLSFDDNELMMSLKLRNTSKFALGFRESEYKMYDFVILKDDEKTLFEAYEQSKFYLTQVQ